MNEENARNFPYPVSLILLLLLSQKTSVTATVSVRLPDCRNNRVHGLIGPETYLTTALFITSPAPSSIICRQLTASV